MRYFWTAPRIYDISRLRVKRNVDEELRRFSQGFHTTDIQHFTKFGKACWWRRLCGKIISTL